jgi:hypothetical protein
VPSFDYNLIRLQAEGTESVAWEYRLLEASDRSSRYAVSMAHSLDELYHKKAQFEALPIVERPRSWDRPPYAFRGGLSGAGASSTASNIAANIERGF